MRTSGYLNTRRRHPIALTAAVALNLGVVASMLLYKTVVEVREEGTLKLKPVTPPEPIAPVEPLPRKPERRTQQPTIPTPVPPMPMPLPPDTIFKPLPEAPLPPSGSGETLSNGNSSASLPIPAVEVRASFDPRFANAVQPPYPPSLERMEVEGSVTVRVEVGPDGRVRTVELVRTDDPQFFEATRAQALSRWRFKPATRDGVAITSWLTKTVSFRVDRR